MMREWRAETKGGQKYKKPEKRMCRAWLLEYSQRAIHSLESRLLDPSPRAMIIVAAKG